LRPRCNPRVVAKTTLAVAGLVCIVVFWQKSEAVRFHVEPKIGVSLSPAKNIFVLNEYSQANVPASTEDVLYVGGTQTGSDRNIDRHGFVIWIENAWFLRDNVIRKSGEADKWEWQHFDPSLIAAVVGGSVTYIRQFNVDMRLRVMEKIGDWITAGARGQLRSVAHPYLIFNRTPLQESDTDINRVHQHKHYRPSNNRSLLGIICAIGLLIAGPMVLVPVCDDLCEDRIGIAQIAGIVFYLCVFSAGQLLLILNLARLIAENG
jgi:hypothetical protein